MGWNAGWRGGLVTTCNELKYRIEKGGVYVFFKTMDRDSCTDAVFCRGNGEWADVQGLLFPDGV
jgi:hypothetical protein